MRAYISASFRLIINVIQKINTDVFKVHNTVENVTAYRKIWKYSADRRSVDRLQNIVRNVEDE
jgi:hypothetical protein